MQGSLASAWAEHGCLFQKSIVVHNVKRFLSERRWERLIDHDGMIRS